MTVPFGTNVTAPVPTIVYTGAGLSPASGAARNFTNPVVSTVTAAAQVLTAADLAGTWVKFFASPFQYTEDPADTADAMIMDFEGNNYTMILYYQTEQVGGQKGTFTVSGGNLIMNPDQS